MRAELIDKCVGSRIWVVMKGDKGTESLTFLASQDAHEHDRIQWYPARFR